MPHLRKPRPPKSHRWRTMAWHAPFRRPIHRLMATRSSRSQPLRHLELRTSDALGSSLPRSWPTQLFAPRAKQPASPDIRPRETWANRCGKETSAFRLQPSDLMNLHLLILALYSFGLMAFGLWIGRRVHVASDFFVAGRQLGPGLIFSTMLAANIGAGSTVGATGIGYSHGVSAWWWVGSAALGSVVLALRVGPSLRRVAAAHNPKTPGDYLEFRYSRGVRAGLCALLWVASIAVPAGQLIAIGGILEAVAAVPFVVGCTLGGMVVGVYFAAGGLLTSAWVNVVQLLGKLVGFAVAVPLAVAAVGGWNGLTSVAPPEPAYWTWWRSGIPGIMYVAALGPAFFLSPGLLQKVFGARDDRAVRIGVGLNALGLFLFAGVPVLLGIVARNQFPALSDERQALPMLLVHTLPPLVGALGLAAVFSAEISAADAGLFML